jgi:hypothetical protein
VTAWNRWESARLGSRGDGPEIANFGKLTLAYASFILFCGSLLAFTACMGYPNSLTAFTSQGIE